MKHSIVAGLSAVLTDPNFGVLRKGGWRKGLRWAARGSWLLINPRTALEVTRGLASAQLRPLLRAEPRLMFKYLYGYVALDLSREERAAMLIDHYALLNERA